MVKHHIWAVVTIILLASEYVLVWLDAFDKDSAAMKLRGMRFDADLKPIDAEPFDVFSGPGPVSIPQLITTPTGVMIAYSRSDSGNGDSPRAFTRSLERIRLQPTHRRAVSR